MCLCEFTMQSYSGGEQEPFPLKVNKVKLGQKWVFFCLILGKIITLQKIVLTIKIGGKYEKNSCSIIYDYDATCDIIECKCL